VVTTIAPGRTQLVRRGQRLEYFTIAYNNLEGLVSMVAAVSAIVMPLLARAKRKVAAGIGSGAMQADSRQTDFCAYLSAILLGGLLLNAVAGWWWADPVAGLVMVPIIAKEGMNGLRGKASCDFGCR